MEKFCERGGYRPTKKDPFKRATGGYENHADLQRTEILEISTVAPEYTSPLIDQGREPTRKNPEQIWNSKTSTVAQLMVRVADLPISSILVAQEMPAVHVEPETPEKSSV